MTDEDKALIDVADRLDDALKGAKPVDQLSALAGMLIDRAQANGIGLDDLLHVVRTTWGSDLS